MFAFSAADRRTGFPSAQPHCAWSRASKVAADDTGNRGSADDVTGRLLRDHLWNEYAQTVDYVHTEHPVPSF